MCLHICICFFKTGFFLKPQDLGNQGFVSTGQRLLALQGHTAGFFPLSSWATLFFVSSPPLCGKRGKVRASTV